MRYPTSVAFATEGDSHELAARACVRNHSSGAGLAFAADDPPLPIVARHRRATCNPCPPSTSATSRAASSRSCAVARSSASTRSATRPSGATRSACIDAIAGAGATAASAPGLSPKAALALGLKVDVERAARTSCAAICAAGASTSTSPATTLALLKLDAVVGVRGFFDERSGRLQSVGITCALCHSTVDDSFAPGIGNRLDGWAARDLNVGAIIALVARACSRSSICCGSRSRRSTQPRCARCCAAGDRASSTPSCCSTARRSARTASRPRR